MSKQEGASRPSRVLLSGDVSGYLHTLYDTVAKQQARVGKFDLLFASGAFLKAPASNDGPGTTEDETARESSQQYLLGLKEPPVPTYFIDSDNERFIEGFAKGKEVSGAGTSSSSSAPNAAAEQRNKLVFLGSHGVKTLEPSGLRVAYLSGRYDELYFEDESQAFHGACYTRLAIEQLKRQAKIADDRNQRGIDIFLVSEWPRGWQNKIYDKSELPPDESDPNTSAEPALADVLPVSELIAALSPRYVVCSGGKDLFYQRPAFQTLRASHVTRMLCLGKVGPKKGKNRKFLHALQLKRIGDMSSDELRNKPDNTTPFPFHAGDNLAGLQRIQPPKRKGGGDADDAEAGEDEDGRRTGDVQLFVSNLPAGLSDKNLRKAMEGALGSGTLLKLKVMLNEHTGECRGFAFATVASDEIAKKALELNLEAGGRQIRFDYKREKANRGVAADGTEETVGGNEEPRAKRPKRCIVVEPHADCWFCLANPKFQRHMLVSVNPYVYVATAKGGVNAGNLILLPVKHIPNYLSTFNFTEFEPLADAIGTQVAAVRQMCLGGLPDFLDSSNGPCDLILWERWVPMRMNHMQVQMVPVPRSKYVNWARLLDAWAEKYQLDFEKIGSVVVPHVSDQLLQTAHANTGGQPSRISSNVRKMLEAVEDPDDVLDKTNSHGLRQLLDRNASRFFANEPERNLQSLLDMPYLYLELPGDSTARGRKMDRYVCYGPGKIPMNFAREMLCDALDCPDRADWRDCQLDGPAEKAHATALKDRLAPFLPKEKPSRHN
ncbi:unnamed protein product [Amoebophrya sp. A25]|nr:unnamed protein product [Amoebophrya sp. A25]|eukprot:GSA25T00005624001.1